MKKLKFLLYPLSLIYWLYTSFRNFLFDLGIIDSIVYKIPTIGVGNLSTGGTGKSIVVDYIIEKHKHKNKITTLSRGYNRNTKGFVQASNISTAYEIGDEPFQYYNKFPNILVCVDADRTNGIQQLEKVSLLDTQYRMNELIMNFSNQEFYKNQLIQMLLQE